VTLLWSEPSERRRRIIAPLERVKQGVELARMSRSNCDPRFSPIRVLPKGADGAGFSCAGSSVLAEMLTTLSRIRRKHIPNGMVKRAPYDTGPLAVAEGASRGLSVTSIALDQPQGSPFSHPRPSP